MILDVTPVQSIHWWLFASSFLLICGGIWLSQRVQGLLTPHRQYPAVKLAGTLLIAVITGLVMLVVPSIWQRLGLIIAAGLVWWIGSVDEHYPLAPRTQLAWQFV